MIYTHPARKNNLSVPNTRVQNQENNFSGFFTYFLRLLYLEEAFLR
jgi:hypothetical protein